MPVRTDLTDALLALIPEDGTRLSNAELRAELLDLADEPSETRSLRKPRTMWWPWVLPRKLAAPAVS